MNKQEKIQRIKQALESAQIHLASLEDRQKKGLKLHLSEIYEMEMHKGFISKAKKLIAQEMK